MKFLLPIFICVLAAGCTSSFHRDGYELASEAPVAADCAVPVKFQAKLPTEGTHVLGTIRATDPGLAIHCDEGLVLARFTRDACALHADVINIVEEDQPTFWSDCYRAKAELVKVANGAALASDDRYSAAKVVKRSAASRALAQKDLQQGINAGLAGAAMAGAPGVQ